MQTAIRSDPVFGYDHILASNDGACGEDTGGVCTNFQMGRWAQ